MVQSSMQGHQNLDNDAEEMKNIFGLQLDNWTTREFDERSVFGFFQSLSPTYTHHYSIARIQAFIFFFSRYDSSSNSVPDLDLNDGFYWNNHPHVCLHIQAYML